jgi:hypothetical protein
MKPRKLGDGSLPQLLEANIADAWREVGARDPSHAVGSMR